MSTLPAPSSSSSPQDPRRIRIRRRLRELAGPGPAAFYIDACSLMDEPTRFSTTSHLVAHAIREIESALRDILEPLATSRRAGPPTASKQSGHETHQLEIQAILSGLDIPKSNPVAQRWLSQVGTYHLRAHRRSLEAPAEVSGDFVQFFVDFEGVLDYTLDRMEANYAKVAETVTRLAAKPNPTEADLKFLLNNIPQNDITLRAFFEVIDASWLPLLQSAGVFSAPPPPVANDDGTISFPPWAPARCLVRFAASVPRDVITIVRQIPQTNNAFANAAIVEAAGAMPIEEAAQLVPRIRLAMSSPYISQFSSGLERLLAGFITGALLNEALEITRGLLGFAVNSSGEPIVSAQGFWGEPQVRIDEHIYRQTLANEVPELIAQAGAPALNLLVELLDQALTSGATPEGIQDRRDYSTTWRSRIEREGSFEAGIKTHLVSALRDGVVRRISAHPEELREVLATLVDRRWSIFRRLALHTLVKFGDEDLAAVEEQIVDRDLFDVYEAVRPEYDLLLSAYFGRIGEAGRSTYLGFVEAGPERHQSDEFIRSASGRDATDEEFAQHRDFWMRRRLTAIASQLPETWRGVAKRLDLERAEPQEGLEFRSGFVQLISPISKDELAGFAVNDLVDYLQSFQPSEPLFLGPSREGLCQALKEVIAADPEKYLAKAEQFAVLDVDYLQAVLAALRRRLDGNEGTWSNWEGFLQLCEGVVAGAPSGGVGMAADGRSWARLDVMHLLRRLIDSGNAPLDQRDRIFAIISQGANDPSPSSGDEARYGPDASSLALNSVRPMAIDAAVAFAHWIRQGDPATSIDDVLRVVGDHLDPDTEPSVGVRWVLGSKFPNLVDLDQGWAERAMEQIFPEQEEYRHLWAAAWDAYLGFGRLTRPCSAMLVDKYTLALNRMAPDTEDRQQQARDRTLGTHLVTMYAYGNKPLGMDPVLQFFSRADEEGRRHALGFIGLQLLPEGSTPSLEQEVIDRLWSLWKQRVETARSQPSNELSAFGWWFRSQQLSREHRLEGLAEALSFSQVEPTHTVVEALAEMSATEPVEAARLLAMMVEREGDGFRLQLWEKSARTIIRAAHNSANESAQRMASEAASRAAARGQRAWLEFE